jgi:hypothetical protein
MISVIRSECQYQLVGNHPVGQVIGWLFSRLISQKPLKLPKFQVGKKLGPEWLNVDQQGFADLNLQYHFAGPQLGRHCMSNADCKLQRLQSVFHNDRVV